MNVCLSKLETQLNSMLREDPVADGMEVSFSVGEGNWVIHSSASGGYLSKNGTVVKCNDPVIQILSADGQFVGFAGAVPPWDRMCAIMHLGTCIDSEATRVRWVDKITRNAQFGRGIYPGMTSDTMNSLMKSFYKNDNLKIYFVNSYSRSYHALPGWIKEYEIFMVTINIPK